MAQTQELTQEQVIDQMKTVLEKFQVPADKVVPGATFQDLEVDSLDLVEITQELEDIYSIEVPDEALENVKSVGDAIALVQKLARSE